jgi:RNA polymerase sigma-70 factor (ECF subfamily)
VSQVTLNRARAGDERAFGELVRPHRRELHLHCYRILGSPADADDALQETLVAAWRGLATFEERSSWRAWLYRIATNRCLNLLRTAGRRPRTVPVAPFRPPQASAMDDLAWLGPYPDSELDRLPDPTDGPEHRVQSRETVELAFVEALQRMPPRQAATLILREVLGFGTAEVADMLDTTPVAVKGALARARAALDTRRPVTRPRPAAEAERALGRRFAEAFAADDIDAVLTMLTDDAWLTMPPAPHRYEGAPAVAAFLRASAGARGGRRFRLLPTAANRQPAFACYLDDPGTTSGPGRTRAALGRPAGLLVLTVDGDRIGGLTRFLDPGPLHRFGVPDELAPGPVPRRRP